MTRRCRGAVLAVVVVVATAGLVLQAPAQAAQTPSADSVLLDVGLTADGDAEWRVEYRYRLDDENATRAFEDLRRLIEADPDRYTGRFAARVRESVRAAENATGREMALRNVTVSTDRQSIPQASGTFGTVTYRFEWTNFAVANDSSIRAGDAIHGFYLDPDTKLIVTWPEEFEPASPVRPSPDEGDATRAVWEGETDFASDEPRIELRATPTPAGEEPTATGTATPASTPTNAPAGGESTEATGGMDPWVLALAGVVALGAVGAGGAMALRRRGAGPGEASAGGEETPPELLSNEERVLAALRDHGGRMKQQELAEACDWHDSKTSKVVTDLKEEGTIEVFRIGRENVISLPEEDHD